MNILTRSIGQMAYTTKVQQTRMMTMTSTKTATHQHSAPPLA
jgi:hypothetical protein